MYTHTNTHTHTREPRSAARKKKIERGIKFCKVLFWENLNSKFTRVLTFESVFIVKVVAEERAILFYFFP